MKTRRLTQNIVLGMMLLAASGAATRAGAQGLGDAAKQQRTRRAQPGRPPAKVYTTDELGPASQQGAQPKAAPAAQTSTSAGHAAGSNQEQDSTEEKGLEYWKERITDAATAFEAAMQRTRAAAFAWNEDAMTRPRKARPVATMTEPGCTTVPGAAEPMMVRGGIGTTCKTIPVHNMGLYNELDAALRAEAEAAQEVSTAWAEARRAGFTEAQLRE